MFGNRIIIFVCCFWQGPKNYYCYKKKKFIYNFYIFQSPILFDLIQSDICTGILYMSFLLDSSKWWGEDWFYYYCPSRSCFHVAAYWRSDGPLRRFPQTNNNFSDILYIRVSMLNLKYFWLKFLRLSIISYIETTYILKEDMDGDYEIPSWMRYLVKLGSKLLHLMKKFEKCWSWSFKLHPFLWFSGTCPSHRKLWTWLICSFLRSRHATVKSQAPDLPYTAFGHVFRPY